jgi:translocation and assembly module TamB
MTNSPNPGNEPEPTSGNEPQQPSTRSSRRVGRRRLGIFLSVILLSVIGGGFAWAWFFVYRQLRPQVEQTVTKILNRPVQLGKLESFSLNSLRFGATQLPATPTDPDRASVEAVDVKFNLIPLITDRTVPLDVTLVKPNAYIAQDKDGVWVATKLQTLPKGAIDFKLKVLRLRNADVVLVPRGGAGNPKTPVALSVPSGKATFLNDNKLIQLDLGGKLASGGNFTIKGETRPSEGKTNLALAGSDLGASEIGGLIQLPLLLQAGKVDGNLELQQQPEQPLKFLGTATLENVTARLPVLPQPFAKTNGQLRFKGTQVRLEKITTLFGQIPAQANGVVDTQSESNLSAQTQPVQLKQVLQTFNFKKLPVAASGEVQAALRVTGPLNKPVVSGEFATTKPALIDRVNFRSISAGFGVVDSTLSVNNLRARPTVGGLVTGRGEIKLGQNGTVVFDAQATDVPGDAIAKNYSINLPVPIGSVSASTRIIASLDNPQNFRATGRGNLNAAGGTVTATNVQLNNGRFSAQVEASGVQVQRLAQVPPQLRGPLSGNFTLSGPLASLTPSTIRGNGSGRLNVAGGTVTATNVQLRNGAFSAQVEASGVEVQRLAQVPPQLRGPLSGNFTLSGPLASLTPSTIRGKGSGSLNVAGGTVTATNVQLNKGRFTAQVQASGVQVQRLAQVPPQVQGPLSGNFTLSGSLASLSPSTISARGSGSLNVAGGTVTATSVELDKGRFTAQVRTSGVEVQRLAQVPPQVQGPLSGNFTLSGSLDSLSPSTISARGSGSLNVGGGTVTATSVELDKGRFTAQVEANGVQVQRLAQVPPQVQGPLSGNFSLSGSLASLSPSTISARGSGSLNVAGGTVTATNVQLNNGRFEAQVEASGVQVERLAQVPPQVQGPLSGNFTLSGSLASLSPSTISARGSGSLNVGGGTVTATNVQLENGRFEAVVEPTGVQLAGFSQELRGNLGGRLNVSGSLAALSPAAIQARGQLNFSEGIALIDRSLTASINWNGQQLEIQQATANGFNANGVVNVNLANTGLQAIRSFDLNVQAQDLNLQQLPATLPEAVQLAGQADFDGRIAGSPTAPNVNGQLELRNFVAGGLAFESPLRGNVSAVPGQGANLQLSGTRDQINVALAANYQPVSFLVQTEGAVASGRRQGELLLVNAQNFPIGIIKKLAPLPTAIATQPLSGRLSGDLAVNLNTYGISGDIAIADPVIGTLRGDSFTGTLQYSNGRIALTDGLFKQGESEYLLSADVIQTPQGPQFQANLKVDEGKLQNVLTALQLFDIADLTRGFNAPTYGKAANVTDIQAGLPQATLQNQLRRLTEIETLLRQSQESQADSPLPPLTAAQGQFTGTVSVVGSLSSGISAEFDIQGQNWEWGPYSANQVIAQGNFQDGVLSLLPLRFQSEDSLLSYSGTVGGDAQSGQLQLRNIPIAQLENVLNLPPAVGFTGLLNATATLAGSLSNPQARGELTLTDATLNQTPVQSAQGSFSYNNARLNFGSTVLVAETDPLTIGGSVPYKLPFASVKPENNQLALNIDVQNEGLALLNLLTRRQVTWVDGKGSVQVKVSGTYDQEANRPLQLVAEGIAAVENATLRATVLPEPLTNVTGRVLFDFDRIRVETVQGQFSGGTVTAAGTIPISQPAPQENPLSVNIGELALNLRGLYNGRVQGDVVVTGTALAPRIGGQVNLFNGQVQLAETGAATGSGGGGGIGEESGSSNPTQFNGLQLTLGRGVQITRAPILDFLANGTLTLNGPLNGIRPEGTIDLQRGQVNLFTTQFRLARGYESTAEFLPSRGLDPVLNVRLVALVTEATQRRLPTDPLSAEISDVPVASFGNVRTVRIQAKVEGPASQLADNLELTSTPSRSEAEIVALLGGGFVDTLGRGDSTLGLANLAGSALLSNVQNIVGDALGLSEFRLFPTIITNDEKRTSALGLSAEAGVDISRSFSVSVLKELTNDQPFQYSLRYRLNEQTLLRGFTDLSGESGAIVEYERRF